MWRQNIVYIYFVLLGRQFIKQNDILRADCIFWCRAGTKKTRCKSSPRRFCLSLLPLLLKLLVENLDEIYQAFLTESNFCLFLGTFVHFHLNFLRKFVLIFKQHAQRLNQRLLVEYTLTLLCIELRYLLVLGRNILRSACLLQEHVLMGLYFICHRYHILLHLVYLSVQLSNVLRILLPHALLSVTGLL